MPFARMTAQGQIINLGRGRHRANKRHPHAPRVLYAVLLCDERRRAKFRCAALIYGHLAACLVVLRSVRRWAHYFAALLVQFPRRLMNGDNLLSTRYFCVCTRAKSCRGTQPDWQKWVRRNRQCEGGRYFLLPRSFLLNIINQHRVLLANIGPSRKTLQNDYKAH
jgi:hypothetical protein